MNPKIESSWLEVLKDEFEKPYMKELREFIKQDIDNGKTIYPPPGRFFDALNKTSFGDIKVVILGQDPYHGEGQAHGLSFSVKEGKRVPPSLINIFKELKSDIGNEIPSHGNLEAWAGQGVLLLNSILSVRAGEPASHSGKGWEIFTDRILQEISNKKENVVFLLWGKYARSKKTLINADRHLILEASHPSPYSAHSGFFGTKHFSKANEFLKSKGIKEIDWVLT